MDVRTFFENEVNIQGAEQLISGWLVIIDNELYLLEENLCEDYKNSMKIKISDRSIIYAIRQAILPLGGGESFVFHKAKLSGHVNMNPEPEIIVGNLYIQECGQENMMSVDISESSLDAAKQRYEEALNFDFFKEMGDR